MRVALGPRPRGADVGTGDCADAGFLAAPAHAFRRSRAQSFIRRCREVNASTNGPASETATLALLSARARRFSRQSRISAWLSLTRSTSRLIDSRTRRITTDATPQSCARKKSRPLSSWARRRHRSNRFTTPSTGKYQLPAECRIGLGNRPMAAAEIIDMRDVFARHQKPTGFFRRASGRRSRKRTREAGAVDHSAKPSRLLELCSLPVVW